MLEEVGIRAGIKGQAKSLGGDNQRSREAVSIQTRVLEEVLDEYPGWNASGNSPGSDEANILAAKIVIVME